MHNTNILQKYNQQQQQYQQQSHQQQPQQQFGGPRGQNQGQSQSQQQFGWSENDLPTMMLPQSITIMNVWVYFSWLIIRLLGLDNWNIHILVLLKEV